MLKQDQKQAQARADWRVIGRLMATFVQLVTLVRNTLAEMGVGIEILPWLIADGKAKFVEALKSLGVEYQKTERVRVINPTTIEVNLEAKPKLPFDGAEVVDHKGEGWVRVEKRKDGLYVDGKKVVLHLSERQQAGSVIKGHDLREELSGKPVLNSNILDALFDHPHLIPEEWKADGEGRTRYIYFWGSVFRIPDSQDLYVRCLYWNDGAWHRHFNWLGDDWDDQRPAALAS